MISIELIPSGADFVIQKESPFEKVLVICPDPQEADFFREFHQNKLEREIEVITISKFMRNYFDKIDQKSTILEKNELLIHLGIIWKKYFANHSSESFFQTYTLFSDLRSYSLDIDLLKEVRDEFEESVFLAIEFFYQYMEQANIIDEHKAYSLIGEYSEKIQFEYDLLLFWGFHRVTPIQVEMLKSLAQRVDIKIPFPKNVFEQVSAWDWISWVVPFSKITNYEENLTPRKKIQYFSFNKGHLGNDLQRELTGEFCDVVLSLKDLQFNHINELPCSKMFFRSPSQLFESYLKNAFKSLREILGQYRDMTIVSATLIEKIDARIGKTLDKTCLDFRFFKVWLEIKKVFLNYIEISDENQNLNLFDFGLIEKVCELNFPRLFLCDLTQKETEGSIIGLKQYNIPITDRKIVLCASNSYPSLAKGGAEAYTDRVLSLLATIGPLQKNDLEFLFYKEKVLKLLKYSPAILLIERELEKNDFFWSQIFDELSSELLLTQCAQSSERDFGRMSYIVKKELTLEKRDDLRSISGTKLQTYIDCPQKYYYKYLKFWDYRFQLNRNLEAFQLGIIEHLVIGRYIQQNMKFNLGALEKMTREELNDFAHKHGVKMGEVDYDHCYEEILSFSLVGIKQLLSLKNLDPNVEYLFEVPVEGKAFDTGLDQYNFLNPELKGSIDCIIKGSFGVGIIDFKRSSFGVPSKSEVLNFDKIQISFYLKHYNLKSKKLSFWGYLNLSDFDKSLIFLNENIDKNIECTLLNSAIELDFPLSDLINDYSKKEKGLVEMISQEKNFDASPRKNDVCNFCQINKVCER